MNVFKGWVSVEEAASAACLSESYFKVSTTSKQNAPCKQVIIMHDSKKSTSASRNQACLWFVSTVFSNK